MLPEFLPPRSGSFSIYIPKTCLNSTLCKTTTPTANPQDRSNITFDFSAFQGTGSCLWCNVPRRWKLITTEKTWMKNFIIWLKERWVRGNLVQYSLSKQSCTAFYVDFSMYWSSDAHELIQHGFKILPRPMATEGQTKFPLGSGGRKNINLC